MAKKHKHPEHENLERWLVSYADFITLLFATFTALYAIAQSDLSKMKDVTDAIQSSFKEQSLISGVKSVLQGKSPPSEDSNIVASERGSGKGLLGAYKSLTYKRGEVEEAEELARDLYEAINKINQELAKVNQGENGGDKSNATTSTGVRDPESEEVGLPQGVELTIQERGLKVSFDSSVLFPSGSAVLKPQARKILDVVAGRLRNFALTHLIEVEGHTDNLPIATAVYPSNWELSTGRASSVVRYLTTKHNFDPRNLAAVGYADSRPVESNLSAAGRAANRRIDIIINSRMVSEHSDPGLQAKTEQTILSKDPKENQTTIEQRPKPEVEPPSKPEPKPAPSAKPNLNQKPGFVPVRRGQVIEGAEAPPSESESGHGSSHRGGH